MIDTQSAAAAPEEAEPLWLVCAGGDGYQAEIVPQSRLDDAYLLTQWGTLEDIDPEDRAAALEHFHDPDEWLYMDPLRGGKDRVPVEFSINFEDGWARVVRLPSSLSEPHAWRDVLAERRRQVDAEGWTPEHDDEHSFGQLARAGAAYAAQSLCAEDAELDCGPPDWWPWDRSWWKPSGRRRMLVKAGALILAEIERLDRAACSTPSANAPRAVEPTEMRADFTDTARAALLWVLWHHQGASSKVGQPLRFALGMGEHDRLSEVQIAEAKRWELLGAREKTNG